MSEKYRVEHDSMGELQVPAEALWGAQTQRAVQNFPVSGQPMPRGFIRALGLVKAAAAQVNAELGLLPKVVSKAIQAAALEVAEGRFDAHFPIDVYQTGSGTSSNMNANEVIATLASRAGKHVESAHKEDVRVVAGDSHVIHPNDHVNLGQSSNDVIPTAIRVSAQLAVVEQLLPALKHLRKTIDKRAKGLDKVVKTGRTHLMDAMPLTFGQEFRAWSAQLASAQARIEDSLKRLRRLPLGGTAIGTGINADPRFGGKVAKVLTALTKTRFESAENKFEGLAAQDDAVELSGQLNALAVALIKIANDLRWMNSGPLAGLGEIELPALQPGSSIMPGKVNPVIPEATVMAAAQVIGHHAAITVAGQTGNFQLNVALPLIAANLLDSIGLLANVSTLLADKAIAGLKVRQDNVRRALDRNPILVTALNPVIGYEKAAAIAKRAYKENRPVLEVAKQDSGLPEAELRRLLDPAALTEGGIAG
ncbi:MAG: class II fumarate hydratase [Pseudomonas sp.]